MLDFVDCGKYMVWTHAGPEGSQLRISNSTTIAHPSHNAHVDPDQMMVVVTVAMQFEAVVSSTVTAMYGATDMAEAGYLLLFSPLFLSFFFRLSFHA